jgi:hypothetical protein
VGLLYLYVLNYVVNAQYNYYISNKGLLKECDKEENVAVTGDCYYFLFETKIVKRSVQCHALLQPPNT